MFFFTRSRTASTIAMETGCICVEEEAGLVSVTGLYPLSYGNKPQRDLSNRSDDHVCSAQLMPPVYDLAFY